MGTVDSADTASPEDACLGRWQGILMRAGEVSDSEATHSWRGGEASGQDPSRRQLSHAPSRVRNHLPQKAVRWRPGQARGRRLCRGHICPECPESAPKPDPGPRRHGFPAAAS